MPIHPSMVLRLFTQPFGYALYAGCEISVAGFVSWNRYENEMYRTNVPYVASYNPPNCISESKDACFKNEFGAKERTDYYKCQTCNMNCTRIEH